ncbi:hypothetical protein [Nonomuraea sp. NPDC049646]|uniref:hypothetical protein n=1 Tax=unclassified Nonomuraea TaxID=2593643 RepID=UPI00379A41A4
MTVALAPAPPALLTVALAVLLARVAMLSVLAPAPGVLVAVALAVLVLLLVLLALVAALELVVALALLPISPPARADGRTGKCASHGRPYARTPKPAAPCARGTAGQGWRVSTR